MFAKSFKWMLLTLLILAALIFGAVTGYRALFPSAQPAALPEAGAEVSPAPTPVPSPEPIETPVPTPTPRIVTPEELAIRAYVETLPVKTKLGQLVMFGFNGLSEPANVFQNTMRRFKVGNIVLYGPNVDRDAPDGGFHQAEKLINRLKILNSTDIPLLVSIDIEGGHVLRFKWENAPSSAATLGRKNDPQLAYDQFLAVGKKLKEIGINMNLAPVLDVAVKPNATFLESRIISSNADIAARIGTAVIGGLNEAACLSTAKHFPGHGATTEDSHAATPVVDKTKEELEAYEFVPFRVGVEAGVDTVLVGHILFTGLDDKDIASMSSLVITDILRGEMGFEGIVMSDDFRMAGLTSRYDVGEAAVKFILSGGDLILCGPRNDLQQKIMNGLTSAAEKGTLSEERINESVVRILMKKYKATGWLPPKDEENAAA